MCIEQTGLFGPVFDIKNLTTAQPNYFKTVYCVLALPRLTMYTPRLRPAFVMALRSSPICSAWNSPTNAPSGLKTLYVLWRLLGAESPKAIASVESAGGSTFGSCHRKNSTVVALRAGTLKLHFVPSTLTSFPSLSLTSRPFYRQKKIECA